jgi:hypothetical protein
MNDPALSVLVGVLPFAAFFLALMLGLFGRLENPGVFGKRRVWLPPLAGLVGIAVFLGYMVLRQEPVKASSPAPPKVPPAAPKVAPPPRLG